MAAIFAACAFAWAAGVHAEGADPAAPAPEAHVGTELVLRALSLLGVNYKLGGNTPDTGLDCSGLVRHVFREAVGLVLPRRAAEISRTGEVIVDTAQLKPGDLVFFNTLRRAFSHVGIYIGNNQFVHAPSSGGEVRVDSMNSQYWTHRFDGARRMTLASTTDDFAAQAAALGPDPSAQAGSMPVSASAAAIAPLRVAAMIRAAAPHGPEKAHPRGRRAKRGR